MDLIDVPAGLHNVAVTDTTVGDVRRATCDVRGRGREGFYHYRQYSAIALAQTCLLEEVWYLLSFAELPSTAQHSWLTLG
jgi:citrate synthase